MKKLELWAGWKCRLYLWAEGDKLRAEGNKLRAEGDKLRAEGDKLRAEGDKLYAEGDKLRAEGNKLWAEGNKLRAEGDKLRAEGDKLYAEGDKLWAEGNKLWAELILETYGNIKLKWKNYNEKYRSCECHLENGDVYGFDSDAKPEDVEVKNAIDLLEKKGKIKDGKIIV